MDTQPRSVEKVIEEFNTLIRTSPGKILHFPQKDESKESFSCAAEIIRQFIRDHLK